MNAKIRLTLGLIPSPAQMHSPVTIVRTCSYRKSRPSTFIPSLAAPNRYMPWSAGPTYPTNLNFNPKVLNFVKAGGPCSSTEHARLASLINVSRKRHRLIGFAKCTHIGGLRSMFSVVARRFLRSSGTSRRMYSSRSSCRGCPKTMRYTASERRRASTLAASRDKGSTGE